VTSLYIYWYPLSIIAGLESQKEMIEGGILKREKGYTPRWALAGRTTSGQKTSRSGMEERSASSSIIEMKGILVYG